jgi:hypothetical protein
MFPTATTETPPMDPMMNSLSPQATDAFAAYPGEAVQQPEIPMAELGLERKSGDDKPEPDESVMAEVRKWQDRIVAAKHFHEPAFERIRDDMDFVGGIQWEGQMDLNDPRYIVNLTMREINQGVAALYARNPKAECTVRPRMDYTAWDGKQESAIQAAQALVSGNMNPMAMQVVNDYDKVQTERQMLKRIAETLTLEYQIQVDRQDPDFKLQMKQFVRRAKVTGVGYVKVDFLRQDLFTLTTDESQEPITNRSAKLQQLLNDYQDKKFDSDDARAEEVKMLAMSIQSQFQDPLEHKEYDERIVFNFPSSTSIIIDPRCRILKGFIGARWIAQEYILPLDDIRAFFNKPDITTGGGDGGAKIYDSQGAATAGVRSSNPGESGLVDEEYGCVWEVYNKSKKVKFFILDGYKDYLLEPATLKPATQRFWPLISFTLNDTETEPGLVTSIYPPSDVRLMTSPQKEWNRSREALRKHRRANAPTYLTKPGAMTDADKIALKNHPDNAVIEIQGSVDPASDLSKLVIPMPTVPISESLYETASLERDIQSTVGSQPENLGAPSSRETATGETIREQSRITATGSNVDDLDDCLTEIAKTAGEMMIKGMSLATVKRDCGSGAVWPSSTDMKEQVACRVLLQIEASSSGRPNKGLEIANFERLAPLLMQAGANPAFLVREGVKRLDDRLDLSEAFPLLPPGGLNVTAQMGASSSPSPNGPTPVSNGTQAGPAVPLPVQTDATTAGAAARGNQQRPSPSNPVPPQSVLPQHA